VFEATLKWYKRT